MFAEEVNIIDIGVDIESIKRFRNLALVKDKLFLEKIFTKKELEYCFSRGQPAQHLAARFCGKEAVIKAISSLNKVTLLHNKIEILNNRRGIPNVILHEKEYNKKCVKLSLSHSNDHAVAFAIVLSK